MLIIKGKRTTAKVMINDVEPSCMAQITHFTNHPAFTNPISIMPDCHAGKGSCIGFTMEMTNKIIPNIVGVDIGCGMKSINIGEKLDISLEVFDRKIRKAIPFGTDIHDKPLLNMEKDFPWQKVNDLSVKFAVAYYNKYGIRIDPPHYNIDWFLKKNKGVEGNLKRMINSIGTLGSGNHFLEVGKSINGSYWITVHSGSRNFGKKICDLWQNLAKKILIKDKKSILQEQIKQIRETYKEKPRLIKEKIQEVKDTLVIVV